MQEINFCRWFEVKGSIPESSLPFAQLLTNQGKYPLLGRLGKVSKFVVVNDR